ncbi:MAG: N(4)-(beta-N-acetylglucosaminyl)-L-asparaginase [Spirosomaceae bacterium]|nr:N(4)-(beta-N-acetylglucosaminyl)-L-asparaginase [Spirosomataceae bacterium]
MAITACTTDNATAKAGINNPNSVAVLPISIATWAPNTGAVDAAMTQITQGKTALDAVEAGARVPEADPNDTSVGYGGFPDRDGKVTLDACIMDHTMNCGSVTYLQNIKHPISVARKVMENTPHVMLSGKGALEFALSEGFQEEEMLTEKAKKAWEEWKVESKYKPIINVELHDTIGIMAIDKDNKIAGACTTSGAAFKMHGRVGDSPIIGAGMYVDDEIGGAVATGLGELVMKTCGSFLIVELMRQGMTPQEACEAGVKRIADKLGDYAEYQVGFIALNKKGEHGAFAIQKGFNYAINQGGETKTYDSGSLIG